MKTKFKVLAVLSLSMFIYMCKAPQQAAWTPVNSRPTFDPNPSTAYLSPEESMKKIYLPKGYHLELVASEPMISEPVVIAWDGNARMYVAEMNTYMQDADATGEQEAKSRILLLEDTNNDGKMDKSSVFIDNLLLPRMMVCINNELLVNETNTITIHSYKDTNGDGKADQKKVVYEDAKYRVNDANMEHQRTGLDWNLDNWMYITYDAVRFRYKDGMLKADSIPSGSGGQWGLTHDNYGRLFYSNAGAENPAVRFQLNPMYGALDFNDQYTTEFAEVFPIIATPDVQGGLIRLRPDSTLNHFTASSGQSIYRGNTYPEDMQGDLVICEPVGRLIRRAKVLNVKGKTTLQNAYYRQEFISSSDVNFRPMNSYTGPDGNLYIVDMHRGIIQQGNWTRPGSFLRKAIDQKGLAKNIGHGRIYRVVYDGYKESPKPNMLNEPASKLVTYLDHPNGWWRDNAQKQIVALNDKSVVSDLKQIASGKQATLSKTPSALAKIHAMWTLEGLEATDKNVLFSALKDANAQVRKTAVWISEPFIKNNDEQMIAALGLLKDDPSYDVRVQLMLSLNYSKSDQAKNFVKSIVDNNKDNPMISTSYATLERNENVKTYGSRLGTLTAENRKVILEGATTFRSLCGSCHGTDGKGITLAGTNTFTAPPLVGSRRLTDKNTVIRVLLHGLTGPVDGKTYASNLMPSMAANNDEWIASVLSYVRFEFGNMRGGGGAATIAGVGAPNTRNAVPTIAAPQAPRGGGAPGGPGGARGGAPAGAAAFQNSPFVTADDIKAIRASNTSRTTPWTIEELEKVAN